MSTLRRDLLLFGAGAGTGLVFSPVPWRLTADAALWSQNWAWLPKNPRGEMTVKDTACGLCPAGCAVRAKLVAGAPVGLAGAAGPLCAAGLCAHHIPFHPSRLKLVLHGGAPAVLDSAKEAAKAAVAAGNGFAVLDLRPGRTASLLYRKHVAAMKGATYITPSPMLSPTLDAVAKLTGAKGQLAFDLARTKVLIGLSTPVLESWGTPSRMLDAGRPFRVWQVEARESGSAMLADRWFRIKPGEDAAFAVALGAAIDGNTGLLQSAAGRCGVDAAQIQSAAAELKSLGAAVVVADGDPVAGPPSMDAVRAAAALNLRLAPGGIVTRKAAAVPKEWGALAAETALDEVPDGSLKALWIDDSAPASAITWKAIAAKLAPNAVVFAACWSEKGIARQAEWALPAISQYEGLHDVATAADAAQPVFALTHALVAAHPGAIEPVEFVGALVGDDTPLAKRLEERAAAVYAEHHDAKFAKAEDFWKAMGEAGARWTGNAAAAPLQYAAARKPELALPAAPQGLVVVSAGWRGADVSPIMGKLWVESDLKPAPQQAGIHPDTAKALGVEGGARATLTTDRGACQAEVRLDSSVPRGAVAMAVKVVKA